MNFGLYVWQIKIKRFFAKLIIASFIGWTMPADANNQANALKLLQNSIEAQGPFTTEFLSDGCSGSDIIKVNTLDKSYVVRFWNMQWERTFPKT